MSQRLLIVRHIACEGPGYLAHHLTRRGIGYDVVKVDEGEALPQDLSGYQGLVLLGGPMSVNDDLPWLPAGLGLIRHARESGRGVLGHCLGAQLIARALGARVGPNPVKEIGWLPVETTPAARAWVPALPASFEAFHWHGETFDLPAGAELLMRSAHCAHQAFRLDGCLALQFHLEVTAEMVPQWCAAYGEEIAVPGPTVQNLAQMTEELAERAAQLHRIADQLYDRWLATLPAA